MTSTVRRSILERLIRAGLQVTPDALGYLLSADSPLELADSIIQSMDSASSPVVLTREYVQSCIDRTAPEVIDDQAPLVLMSGPDSGPSAAADAAAPPAPDTDSVHSIQVLKNPAASMVGSAGTVDDFLALFTDRFRRIKRMYMGRVDTHDAVSIEVLKQKKISPRRRRKPDDVGEFSEPVPSYTVIGMVRDKRVSRQGNVTIDFEDFEGSITCVIPGSREGPDGRKLLESGNSILLDEVICVSGRMDQPGRMIADRVTFPDVPIPRDIGRAKRDVYAVFISDLHCGSYHFLEDEFDRFISWISGHDLDSTERSMVDQIEYLFIAGDLCDGVGVYPGQQDDLRIPDIAEQYAYVARKLRNVPEHVKIVCIPGNHDACRQALPRPPIPNEFAKPLYDLGERLLMMGDPCHLRVEGVNILITHGDSLDDLTTQLPGVTYEKPDLAMKALLQKRHLAPVYGGKTELAPLTRDWMVVDTPPDIVHFGHAHHNVCDNYRQVQIINSGCFQRQTEFMKKQGIKPTPGIVTLLNLRTFSPEIKLFYSFEDQSAGDTRIS
ncbi:MAG: hypothetical protein C4K49_04685 [Candidatus Thorarchaeota archaeon]|nr:MAG: hypothetical protein C4K49_04685 [Candidatus Thorarchaeota archaeon]